ncbi:acyltransferase domain-containing protein [Kribbella antibiotica]|uniref:Acyltransferase domain-containing protein n=1 Tax=Kribbella antibiotica TaxID=190195 RepID=A0A4R4ZT51_9ACTN|nr:acyl carrier protein [Kribbella antibiotica]TDD61169.1 acyltransferase domain-containing protein [Kribbella antibiotica]
MIIVSDQELRGFLVERLAQACWVGVGEIDPDRLLNEYGLSSRDAVAITGELSELLDRPLQPESLWRYPTVNQLVRGLIAEGREIAIIGWGRGDEDARSQVEQEALERAGLFEPERLGAVVDESAVVAVRTGVDRLRAGEADVVVATGVSAGCASVVLKRLPDAERDGDRVLSVISELTSTEDAEVGELVDAVLDGDPVVRLRDASGAELVLRRVWASLADIPLQGVGHFALSDTSIERISLYAGELAEHLRVGSDALANVEYTLARQVARGPVRTVVVARDRPELLAGLSALAGNTSHPAVVAGEAAAVPQPVWVFSGEQPWFSLRGLMECEPAFAATIGELDPLLQWASGLHLRDTLLTGAPPEPEQEPAAQYGVQLALALLWRQFGLTPAAVVGLSTGRLAAAVLAGALTATEGAQLIAGQPADPKAPRIPYYESREAAAQAGHHLFLDLTLPRTEDPAIVFHRQLASLEALGHPLTPRAGRITDLPLRVRP